MRDVAGRVAFITGGASGIGLGMAGAFTEAGMRVVIADVRDDHLEEAGERLRGTAAAVRLIKLDVTDRAAWPRAADEAESAFGPIHVLCANAGIGVLGTIAQATWDDWDWLMGVNLGGVVNAVTTLVPRIRAHGEGGHIMATSSLGGLVASGDSGIYSTAKFAVVAMMECLRQDLARENIGVSVLCPAGVNTNIHDHAGMRPAGYARTGYQPTPEGTAALRGMLAAGSDPLAVGRLVLRAIQRNEPYILTDPAAKAVIESRKEALLAAIPDDEPDIKRLDADLAMRRVFDEAL